jgi:hypothetical protein
VKTGRKASGDVSAAIAYAEIFAEVQQLQALLNDIGLNKTEEPKQRKKRTLKPKQQEIIGSVKTSDENEASASATIESASTVEHASEELSQQQIQTETLLENLTEDETKSGKASIESQPEALQDSAAEAPELTQQEIQVESLKNNLDEAEDGKPSATVHKPRYVVSNLEEIRARERAQREDDDDPFAPIKDASAEAKTQDTPSAIAPQEEQSNGNKGSATLELVGSDDGNKDEYQPSQGSAKSANQQESKNGGYAENLKAERLAKLGVDPNEEITTSKLEHDKSGHAWGNWSETPADEIEPPDSPE